MSAGRISNAHREREASIPSFSYTPTAVRQYPNGSAPIPNSKRKFYLSIRLVIAIRPTFRSFCAYT